MFDTTDNAPSLCLSYYSRFWHRLWSEKAFPSHSPPWLRPCIFPYSLLSAHTMSKDWWHLLTRGTRFLGHGGKALSYVQVMHLQPRYTVHDRRNIPCLLTRPAVKLCTMPYMEHKHALTLPELKPGNLMGIRPAVSGHLEAAFRCWLMHS